MNNPAYIDANFGNGMSPGCVQKIDFSFDYETDYFLEVETNFMEGHPFRYNDQSIQIHSMTFPFRESFCGGNEHWTLFQFRIDIALALINTLKANKWHYSSAWTQIANAWNKPIETIHAGLLGIEGDIQPVYINPSQIEIFKNDQR